MSFVTCPLGVAVDRSRTDEVDEQFSNQLDSLSRLQVNDRQFWVFKTKLLDNSNF